VSWRVLRLPSLADDLEEVLVPTDKAGPLNGQRPPPEVELELLRCPTCGRTIAGNAGLASHYRSHSRPAS
jgi:hypothetical protein